MVDTDTAALAVTRTFDVRIYASGVTAESLDEGALITNYNLEQQLEKMSGHQLESHVSRGIGLLELAIVHIQTNPKIPAEYQIDGDLRDHLIAQYIKHVEGKFGPPDMNPEFTDMAVQMFELQEKDPNRPATDILRERFPDRADAFMAEISEKSRRDIDFNEPLANLFKYHTYWGQDQIKTPELAAVYDEYINAIDDMYTFIIAQAADG